MALPWVFGAQHCLPLYVCGESVTKLCPTLVTPWTKVCQAHLSMGFTRQEYWSGLSFPSPGDLADPGIEPLSCTGRPSPAGSVRKESSCNAGDCLLIQEMDSIPGLGRSPGEGNGNPLQYSSLGNPMDRLAWWAIVDGVTRLGHDLAINPPQNFVYHIGMM